MSYLLITSIFHVGLTSTLISVGFIIWILSILFNLSTQENPKKNIFNLGLLMGVSILIFFPSFLFVLLVLFGLLIFRPFRIQEWIIMILGIVAPFYFVFAFGFLLDKVEILTMPSFYLRMPKFNLSGFANTNSQVNAGDFEFIVRVFSNADIRYLYIPKSLVCMQAGGISTSGWRATLLLNREMLRACKANAVRTNWVKILLRYPLKFLEFFG
jgi:hypothetical protein